MRHSFRTAILPLAALALTACEAREDATTRTDSAVAATPDVGTREEAQIRVVHAVPGGPAVDVYAGDQSAFSKVEFKTVTPYRELGANLPEFKLLETGAAPTATPMAENREVVIDGRYYTLIAIPKADGKGVDIKAIRDDHDGDDNKARIRIVNAARGLDDLDVRIQGSEDALFDDIDFSTEAGYKEVDPGTVTLVVTAEDSKKELLRISDVTLEAGKSLLIVLTHPSASSTRLEAIRVTESPTK
jgi:hypothetical protein